MLCEITSSYNHCSTTNGISWSIKRSNLSFSSFSRLQYSIFFFIGAIVLQGDISFRKRFIKNGFRETSYGYLINLRLSCLSKKPWYQWKLKCVLEETSRHSNTAIKVVGEANETIGHIPEWLSKVVALVSTEKRNHAFSWGWSDWTSPKCSWRKMDVRGRNQSSMHLQILWSQKEQNQI